jgi:hypothetical protein
MSMEWALVSTKKQPRAKAPSGHQQPGAATRALYVGPCPATLLPSRPKPTYMGAPRAAAPPLAQTPLPLLLPSCLFGSRLEECDPLLFEPAFCVGP